MATHNKTGRRSSRRFIKCPACGKNSERHKFVHGALGRHVVQTLTQHFVGCGNGSDDHGGQLRDKDTNEPLEGRRAGAFRWSRAFATRDDLNVLGRSLVMAARIVRNQLQRTGDDLPDVDPVAAIQSLDLDTATELVEDWLAEAEDELQRRKEIVDTVLTTWES
jgi:hypothetical protein